MKCSPEKARTIRFPRRRASRRGRPANAEGSGSTDRSRKGVCTRKCRSACPPANARTRSTYTVTSGSSGTSFPSFRPPPSGLRLPASAFRPPPSAFHPRSSLMAQSIARHPWGGHMGHGADSLLRHNGIADYPAWAGGAPGPSAFGSRPRMHRRPGSSRLLSHGVCDAGQSKDASARRFDGEPICPAA